MAEREKKVLKLEDNELDMVVGGVENIASWDTSITDYTKCGECSCSRKPQEAGIFTEFWS